MLGIVKFKCIDGLVDRPRGDRDTWVHFLLLDNVVVPGDEYLKVRFPAAVIICKTSGSGRQSQSRHAE